MLGFVSASPKINTHTDRFRLLEKHSRISARSRIRGLLPDSGDLEASWHHKMPRVCLHVYVVRSFVPFVSFHFISFHFIAIHFISLQFISFHLMSCHIMLIYFPDISVPSIFLFFYLSIFSSDLSFFPFYLFFFPSLNVSFFLSLFVCFFAC